MDEENRKVLVAAVVVAGVAAGGWYAWKRVDAPPAPAPSLSSPAPVPVPAPPPDLPKLEESDAFVRVASAGLSKDAAVADWLKQEDLLARFVSAASQVSRGLVPRDGFSAFAPRGKFSVVKQDGKTVADPRSWTRYDRAASAVASVDAAAAAAVFKRFEPLIQQAYRGLGEGGDARDAVAGAAAELLSADPAAAASPLKQGKKGITWVYADESLESASLARKQLLRMGPANATKVQGKVREVALALGVPASRLEKR